MAHQIMKINDIVTNHASSIAFVFAGAIVMFFIFSPAIHISFYNGDAYRYVFGGFGQSCKSDDGFEFMLTLGRPLQAYLDCFVYKFAYTLERMKVIRLLSVVLMGCTMGMFAEWLYRLGMSVWVAFFAAGCLFLVPHLYEDAVLAGALSLPVALLFTQIAYRYLQITASKPMTGVSAKAVIASAQTFFAGRGHSSFMWSRSLWPAIFIMLALLTYPAMAFFFCALILTKLMFSNLSDWVHIRKEIFQELLLFSVVCVIYFILAYLNMRFHPLAPVPSQYQLNHPNLSIAEVIHRLSYLANVFGQQWEMMRLYPGNWQGWVMIGVFLSGILFATVKLIKHPCSYTDLAQGLTVFFILMIMSSGFFLVIPSGEPPIMLRFLFGTIAFGFIVMLWSIKQWDVIYPFALKKPIISSIVAVIFLMESYQASVHTFVSARAVQQYMSFAVQKISDYVVNVDKLQRIHFILAEQDYPYTKFFMTKEILNILGHEDYQLQWCSLPRGMSGKEEDYQPEAIACVNRTPENGIAITYSYPKELFIKTEKMLIVDMQKVTIDNYRQQNLRKYFNIEI